jgi:hypothetical protein
MLPLDADAVAQEGMAKTKDRCAIVRAQHGPPLFDKNHAIKGGFVELQRFAERFLRFVMLVAVAFVELVCALADNV